MARRPCPSPLKIAIERLGRLAVIGTSPTRMQRAAREIIGGWKAVEDRDRVKRWVETLHADIAAALYTAEGTALSAPI